MRITYIWLLLLICPFLVDGQAALSIQGTIQKSFGGAVDDGEYSLTFNLYEQLTGGSPVWTETNDKIEVISGVYSAELGTITPLNIGFNKTYFLGVQVDGGSELIPRTKLTSAPYALSLIGVNNIFPSSGWVGIGTDNPSNTAGSGIQIKDENNGLLDIGTDSGVPAILLNNSSYYVKTYLSGSIAETFGSASNYFSNHTRMASLDIDGTLNTSSANFGSTATFNSTANFNGTTNFNGTPSFNGGANFGGTTSIGYLSVTGGINYTIGNTVFIYGGTPIQWNLSYNFGDRYIAMKVSGDIAANGIFIESDKRIKKDLKPSIAQNDLSTVLRLKPTEYRYIDNIKHGNQFKLGFIAQDIEKVFPSAVNTIVNFIPNIYQFPQRIQKNASGILITTKNYHDLEKDDRIKIFNGTEDTILTVSNVIDSMNFLVADNSSILESSFIYGKEVNDFKTIDFDAITTITVSSIQSLASEITDLKNSVETLQTEVKNQERLHVNQQNLYRDLEGKITQLNLLIKGLTPIK